MLAYLNLDTLEGYLSLVLIKMGLRKSNPGVNL